MQVKTGIFVYFSCLIILLLTMGYALLNQTLSVEATGIIGTPPKSKFSEVILSNEEATLNTGDGLYEYNSKYYYSGANVNNYVVFNDEIWRIISIDENGSIKIIKEEVVSLELIAQLEKDSINGGFWLNNSNNDTNLQKQIINDGQIPFDYRKRRPSPETLENAYCIYNSNGCNAYDKGTYLNKFVAKESLMKMYLEQVYFPNMTALAKEQVENYTLNIGIVETNKNIDVVLESEKTIQTISNIGLLNISDYMYATHDSTCRKSFDKINCATENWLTIPNYAFSLLNGKYTSANAQMWIVTTTGQIISRDANNRFYLRPVVVLNKNITATGTGNKENNDMYILGDIIE